MRHKKTPLGGGCIGLGDGSLGVGYASVGKIPVNGLTVGDLSVRNTSVCPCIGILGAEQGLAALLFFLLVLQDGH